MAYFHGVKASEIATSVIATVQTTAGLPIVFGTAPVHLTKNPSKYVNKPVICYSWDEAVQAIGYHHNWDKYTLSEAMYTEFKLYAVNPIVFVNVLDPKKHKSTKSAQTYEVTANKEAIIQEAVLKDTLVVEGGALGTDYTAAFNDDGELVIGIIKGGALDAAQNIKASFSFVDTSLVREDDIINSFEELDKIYGRFGMVPGIVAAPGYSEKPTVAAVMQAKALNIDNLFRCIVLADVDTAKVTSYQDVNEWKNKNGYTGNNEVVCFPCVRSGDMLFHMSTHIMGIIGVMDQANTDVPYESPSNKDMHITGMCLKTGEEVNLTHSQANLLNSQGVMTGLNFIGGWKSWGNYTGAFPGKSDVKDTFICVRRMFDWQYQTFILNYWQKVDQPLMPRLVRTIVDSEQIRLNGLVSRGFLLGASVLFLEEENPTTDLLAGIIRIHTKITPPVPAQDIEDIIEYDVNNFTALFDN